MIKIHNCKIILPSIILTDSIILIENEIILYIGSDIGIIDGLTVDMKGNYVAPGFIDIHLHGGGGDSFMDCTRNSFESIVKFHEQHGTTKMMPTSLSTSNEELLCFLDIYNEMKDNASVRNNLLGVHLEGPYLSAQKCGAQNLEYCKKADEDEYNYILEYCHSIKRWTNAPEMDDKYEFSRLLCENGILVSAGHTDALFEEMEEAFSNGYSHITHMYSAMNGVTYVNGLRCAGAIEAIFMNSSITVELIADGKHLPAQLIEFVHQIKGSDKIALVTDAMRASGTETQFSCLGSYKNGQKVLIEDGVAKLLDRSSLAGSIATFDKMISFMYKNTNISLNEIIRMSSLTPAKILGVDDKMGSIEKGKVADLVVFDEEIDIKMVITNGQVTYKLN